MGGYKNLSSYQATIKQIQNNWPAFLKKRDSRLEQQRRYGSAAEKVAENILEDLFTEVLDWRLQDLNNQIDYADLILTSNGIKNLIIEAKRPGSLAWNQRAIELALDQALRYAAEQRVKRIAVSDGLMIYAADIESSGLRDRLFVSLASVEPPNDLWWLSQHGIYRPAESDTGTLLECLPRQFGTDSVVPPIQDGALLHPKYKIPARCFAYVGDASKTSTWKLPYRLMDGSPDVKRLSGAVRSILTNYRGAKLTTVPEVSIPDVLVCLAKAAVSLGKMPFQSSNTVETYRELERALIQLGRYDEIKDRE